MCIVESISKERFLKLEENIVGVKNDVTEIKDALLGNKYNPNGIMSRVSVLEDDVQSLNKKVDNDFEIRLLKEKINVIEKGTRFWVTLSNNKWIAALIFAMMYAFTIKEIRDVLFGLFKIMH